MNPDLLVLGGGPAGFAISYLMAQRGFSVEIIDPAFFPRPKICGEFLNPQAVEWLKEQNLFSCLLELEPFPIRGMKITDRQGRSFTGNYYSHGEDRGFAVMRKDFDALMIRKAREAGVQLREGHRAERLLFDGDRVDGVSGTTSDGNGFTKRARIVIGADGRNNLIGRTFGWMKGIRKLRKYAFVTYFQNLPGLDHYGEIHLVPNGYIGIAPLLPDLANVALVVDESVRPSNDSNPLEFFLSTIRQSNLRDRFATLSPVAPLIQAGPLAFQTIRNSGYGTLLVGDTCGFIDPFTGEGINYAFLSANLAVPVLEKALRSQVIRDDVLSEYDAARRGIFERKFQMAKLLQKAIEWPLVSNFLVRKFQRSFQLGDTIVSAVGSAIPVERVWSLRFLLKVVLS
jgi:menaquinone-9 beta-reductase